MINNHGKLEWNMSTLHKGCILAGIAHAMMLTQYPVVANEHSWDGCNYSVQDSDGSKGTVSFADKFCVGAFCNGGTERAEGTISAIEHLWNAPLDVLNFARDEAFHYLLEIIDYAAVPVITTAFWGDENGFHINDTYDDFMEYGGFLLLRQNLDFEEAVIAWAHDYEMNLHQVELLKSIYTRKIADPDERIVLTRDEISIIDTEDPEGIEESKISFAELNIYWE